MTDRDFFELIQTKQIKLTDKQKKAVTTSEGVVLVISVPGSGKTLSSIIRIGYLILVRNINPNLISCISFSKAAALEMKNRFNTIFGDSIKYSPHFSTIHSLCYLISRTYFKMNNIKYKMIENYKDPINKKTIISKIYFEHNKEQISEDELELYSNKISLCKNNFIYPQQVMEKSKTKIELFDLPTDFIDIYNNYYKTQKTYNYIDFDDMLIIANNLLAANKEIQSIYVNKFEYMQIDEAQDCSPLQYKIIEKLNKDKYNLAFFGDDDQTIYEFQGSDPKLLLNLPKQYKNTQVIYMDQNFRSYKNLVKYNEIFINKNKERFNKKMIASNDAEGSIELRNFTDFESSNKTIFEKLIPNLNGNIGILYRNNMSAIPMINYCINHNIHINIKAKFPSLSTNKIIKDILRIYYFSQNMNNAELYLQIVYKIKPIYISKSMLNKVCKQYNEFSNDLNIFDYMRRYHSSLDIPEYMLEKINDICFDFEQLAKHTNPAKIISFIFNILEYKEYLNNDKKSDSQIVDIIKYIAKTTNTINEFIIRIKEIDNVILQENDEDANITLNTIHSSKGLEWSNVIITDINNNIFDTFNKQKEEKIPTEAVNEMIESTRRLLYVGCTRAKANLYILYNEKDPSVFIYELQKINKNKDNNDKSNDIISKNIYHKKFGEGKIQEIKGDNIIVLFKTGIKTLSKEICKQHNLLI
ncbi:ATP-dependent helicase [Clostridium botulinum]|uniref:ATP-dependent helicase n=1 Tax=Clostridium botulinum TaxID=1491 RepID=UPI00016BB304|nr:ATP-dependent helicase [Clostridium botulinum]EDT84111.1 UvrD/REP helicase [Clostridium botulinum Bf]MBY6881632.1 ATP-dependent helicase [Clostridium botulinum]NEZ86260.1 ATP-dependent helicase [Clostridium botulinum]NFB01111.1 ATP-dependent helicase [Clostridium botulinum]WCJ75355.1 ATP-dependent helicase [Clostridium botulinum]